MALEGGQGDHACPNNFSPTPKVRAIKPAIPCPELVQGPGPKFPLPESWGFLSTLLLSIQKNFK